MASKCKKNKILSKIWNVITSSLTEKKDYDRKVITITIKTITIKTIKTWHLETQNAFSSAEYIWLKNPQKFELCYTV